jgi:7,8-dihydropterin-6-yl-methyl-4-(beta-D-ribofuranosyl)aminobenzene 5'-phosphate synthase
MKITTLIENTKLDEIAGLQESHGVSLHIEKDGLQILFDTGGPRGKLLDNAKIMGANLEQVEFAVISHRHIDHGGGLPAFFESNKKAPVYIRKTDDTECYCKFPGMEKEVYIGLDKELCDEFAARFRFVDGRTEIAEDVFILTDIAKDYPRPAGNEHVLLKRDGKIILDEFNHELMMVIKDKGELVIITGCSHSGILNMVKTAKQEFAGIPIKMVIGGFHLMLAGDQTMAGTKEDVEEIGREMLKLVGSGMTYSGHCTGKPAYDILKGVMGGKLGYFATGAQFKV